MGSIEGRYTSRNTVPCRETMRSNARLLTLATLTGVCTNAALAFGTIDPFDTSAITPPRPNLSATAEGSYAPCKAIPSGSIYGLLEVVDQALCQNPNTHEVWANARVQAAQVGVAQSAFLPKLDGNLATSRVRKQVRTPLYAAPH